MYQSILVRSGRSAVATFSAIIALALMGSSLVAPSMALAFPPGAVNIGVAIGGEAVSIDKTRTELGGTGEYTQLDAITISETAPGQITTGLHTINLPSGWEFNQSAHIMAGKGGGMVLTSSNITPELTSFSFNVVTPSTSFTTLMLSGMEIRPTVTNIADANGIMTHSGVPISGVTDGSTSFGTLSTVASTVAKVVFSTQPGATTVYGSNLSTQPVVKTQDHFGNDSVVGLGVSKIVTLSLTSGTGALLGTASLDIGTGAGNGTATSTDVTVDTFGAGKQLTASADSLTPAISSDFEITKKTLTATITASNKPYDGNNSATLTGSPTPVGPAFSDVLTISGGPSAVATFADANAGPGKIVTATGLILNGAKADNYTYDYTATGRADITPLEITITPTPGQTKVYDNNASTVLTYSPSPALIDSSFTGLLGRVAGEDVGTYSYTLGDLSAGANYSLALVANPGTFGITQRPITVTASANTKPYDGNTSAVAIPTITVGSLAAGDTMSNFIETYFDVNVSPSGEKLLAASGTAGGNSGNNYSYTFPHTMNGIITKKELTVTGLSATSRPYNGDTDATITGTPVLEGKVGSEVISLSGTPSGLFNNANAGSRTVAVSGLTLNATEAVKANYTLTLPTLHATISAKAITITPTTGLTKVYGQDDPFFGYTNTALIGSDGITGVLGRAGDKNVGTYTYTLGSLSAGTNYSLALGDSPSGPSIVVDLGTASSFAALGTSVALTTSVTTGDTGSATDNATAYADFQSAYNAVTSMSLAGAGGYSDGVLSGTLAGVTLLPGVYSFDSAGKTGTLTLNANGDPNAVWIFKGVGTLTATDFTVAFSGGVGSASNVFWWTPASADVTLTRVNLKGTILSGAAITITGTVGSPDANVLNGRALATGGVTIIDNTVSIPSSGSSTSTFVITPKLLTVTATGVNREYTANQTATVTLSTSDKIGDDDITLGYTGATFIDSKNIGENKPVSVSGITVTGTDAGNYTLDGVTTATTTANITQKTLTATITVDPKVYDGFNSATILTRTLNAGVIGADIVTLNADGAATFDTKNVGEGKTISTTGITLGGADAGNYALTQPSRSDGVITPKLLTVTATGEGKMYDRTTDAAVAVILLDDSVDGDEVMLGGTATFDTKNVGTGKTVTVTDITKEGKDADNYTLFNTTASATANITPAPLTATTTVKSKVHDGNNSATILIRALIGVLGTDDVTPNLDGTATFAGTTIGTHVVSATGITLAGADKNNYSYDGTATGTGNILSTPTIVYVDKTYTDSPTGAGTHTFGYDAFTTINEGITAVDVGGTVNVAAGAYSEILNVNKSITLQGAGQSAVTGTIINSSTTGAGVSIGADNVTLKNLSVDRAGYGSGVQVANISVNGLTFDGVTVTGASNAVDHLVNPYTGFRVATSLSVNGLTVTNSHFDGNDIGWYLAKDSANSSTVTNVNVTNTTFSNNLMKGLYAEKLNATTLDGLTVANSGTDATYGFNAGIDINLKWSAYSGITIKNSSVTGSGLAGTAVNMLFPAGITIKARDDASSYNSIPASLTNVTLDTITVSGGVVGVRFGEAGKVNLGPSSVTVINSSLSGTGGYGLANVTSSNIVANQNWWGTTDGAAITVKVFGSVNYRSWCVEAVCTTVDNGAPTVTISSTATSPTKLTSIPVSVNFSEAVSDFSAADITVTNGSASEPSGSGADYTITITPSGTGEVTIKINVSTTWDASGNYNIESDTFSRTYDNVAPTATVGYSTTAPTNQNVIATITPNETVTGDLTHTFTDNGSFTFDFTDAAGNPGTVEATVSNIDKSAPVVALTAPTANARVNGSTVITFTNDSDLTPTVAECSVDSSVWVTCTSGTTTLGDVTGFSAHADGAVTLYLRDADTAGNPGTTNVALVKDTSTPTVSSHTPSINAVNVDTNTITIVFNEAVNVSGTQITISPVASFTIGGSGTNTITLTTASPLDSNTAYIVTVTTSVKDLAGNAVGAYSWSFTTATLYNVALNADSGGWNLISLPVVPTNTSISTVLGSASSAINAVWTYDPTNVNADDTNGGWFVYYPNNAELSSNLSTMTAGYGYWISVSSDTNISGSGSLLTKGPTTPPSMNLTSGWNLVGYYQIPGESSSNMTNAFKSIGTAGTGYTALFGFDNATGASKNVVTILPGDAFWISVSPNGGKNYTPSNL